MVLAGLAAFGLLYAAQPVLPQMGAEFGVGPSTASLAVSAATGALALAVLPAAAVATAGFWRLLPSPVAEDAGGARSTARSAVWPLLRRPEVLLLVVVPFTLMGGFVAVYNYLGYRLSGPPFDLPPALIGLFFLAYLAGTVASAVAGRAADRLGRPRVLVVSVVVMVLGLCLTLPDRLPLVLLGLVVLTGGFFAAHATASGWAPLVTSPYGTEGSALYVGAYYAGSSVFGLAVGQAWAGAGWGGVVGAVAALAAVGLAAGLGVGAVRRRHRDDF